MKRTAILVVLALLGLAASCSDRPVADLVLLNGNIHTVDSQTGSVEALAAVGGAIVAVGASDEIRGWIGGDTRVIDLDGKFAMPGFNDAHVHLHNAGLKFLGVDLTGVRSIPEFQERIRARLGDFEPGDWIQGRGWDHSLFAEGRVPTRAELDAVSTVHALIMRRSDGHSVVLNSLALERAGFGPGDEDYPRGYVIERDGAGVPTGWVKEQAASYAGSLVPPLTRDQRLKGYRLAIEDAFSNGVTSVQDDSIRMTGAGWDSFLALRTLKDRGQLDIRVTTWLPFTASLDQLNEWRDEGGVDDPWLKTGLLKVNIDGSGGSLSAAMLEPYATAPDNSGVLIIAPDEFTEMAVERAAAGFQLGIHAIGDNANRVVLDAFEAAIHGSGRADARHRIEHAQFIHDDDLGRFAEMGVIASMQPSHVLTDMRWAPEILGPAREHEGYRWHGILESGAILAFGTDYPVEPINPMRGLYAAVTREFEDGGPVEGGWLPDEKISIGQAIYAYTVGAAVAEFEEARKGTLVPGKFADIVVLDTDLTEAAPGDILSARVLMTIVGGKVVYEAE